MLFFQKQTLYANTQINFGELKVKVLLHKYKQLAISGTGVFSFCNLLCNKHISGIFVHLTIRAYQCMVGKANQSMVISVGIAVGVTYKFQYHYPCQR